MQQDRNNKGQGSVTIYMTLMLAVLLSLFLALVESARERAVELVAACGVDLAVYSVFAEYSRDLLEEYDLLFVDTSYMTEDTSGKALEAHLEKYIEENLSTGKQNAGRDLTGTFLEEARIVKRSYATDEGGEVFFNQAVAFMKEKYGVSYLEKLQKELQTAGENDLFEKDVDSPREANEAKLQEAAREGVETGETDKDGNPIRKEAEFENPADGVNAGRSAGPLSLVTGEKGVSDRAVKRESLLSVRGVGKSGDGMQGRTSQSIGKLWFELYVKEHCGCYTSPKDEGVLTYQQEYVIGGKDNDRDNLSAVVKRLLALREAANVAYLFSDAAKVSEAEALALSIATAAGVPVITELLKISLLFAWAFAESVWDVKCLLAGRKVALIKTAADWHYSLEGMLSYASDQPESETHTAGEDLTALSEGKLGYEDYLFLFMSLESKDTLCSRMMDIAEMDVRSKGDYGFCLDDCVDHILVEASVGSKRGSSAFVRREFSYR
ncbi:MAG: DUF5702 domain-containing protein [Lachnospiraceae bacterium]|nr:DUF5702 domain-containing protein [Lachnospiraceae bacterium]